MKPLKTRISNRDRPQSLPVFHCFSRKRLIMSESIIQRSSLVIAMSAMNRTGFDFVGKYIAVENGCLLLKNPLALDYGEDRVLKRLAPLHVPSGTVDESGENILALPLEGLAYYLAVPENGGDWMHEEYARAFGRE